MSHLPRLGDKEFQVGQLVEIKQPLLKKGNSRKFRNRWKGPWKITRKISDVNYEIINLKGPIKEDIIHVSRMKPYYQRVDNDNDLTESEDEVDHSSEIDDIINC